MSAERPLGIFIVCDQDLPLRLRTAQRLGIPTAQILAPAAEERTPEKTAELQKAFADAGLKITVVFCGFPGESYADIPTVKRTVGLAPESTRRERLLEAKQISDFARRLGVDAIGLHIGFIPEDPNDPNYKPLVSAVCELAQYCAGNGQRLHLETGQETAETLLRFIKDVDAANLAVNFDPANMILYGSGEPLPALRLLGRYVRSVHCKDARWAEKPGREWGVETPLGEGQVNMAAFIAALDEIGYQGPLTIEREIASEAQAKDIEKGVQLLRRLLGNQ
ncbi:MAG: sugar phosphate isomerase/epimerase [candidate division KSB1 bacterium]|nr:sugar phosphate isomerase/epimerase [candidate division KSB1 bacterium]